MAFVDPLDGKECVSCNHKTEPGVGVCSMSTEGIYCIDDDILITTYVCSKTGT